MLPGGWGQLAGSSFLLNLGNAKKIERGFTSTFRFLIRTLAVSAWLPLGGARSLRNHHDARQLSGKARVPTSPGFSPAGFRGGPPFRSPHWLLAEWAALSLSGEGEMRVGQIERPYFTRASPLKDQYN